MGVECMWEDVPPLSPVGLEVRNPNEELSRVTALIAKEILKKDFLSAVNELVKKTLIIPSYHKGKSQERVYLADNKNKFLRFNHSQNLSFDTTIRLFR